MNYKDVIYPPITNILDTLIAYTSELLDNEETEELQDQFDVLEYMNDEISKVYLEELGNPCLSNVKSEMLNVTTNVLTQNEDWQSLDAYIDIFAAIEGDGTFDLEQEMPLDSNDFLLRELSGNSFSIASFANYNPDAPSHSLAYLDISERITAESISNSGFNIPLLAIFAKLLIMVRPFKENAKYILYGKCSASQLAAESALKLLATAKGNTIHKEILCLPYELPEQIYNKISPEYPYNQFDETLIIFSEINGRKDMLGRYLCVYHVLESLMFKIPLVNLGSNSGGQIFSIRDFRRLFDKINQKESKAITDLFQKPEYGELWTREIDSILFKMRVNTNLTQLEAGEIEFDQAQCDEFISRLSVGNKDTFDKFKTNLTGDIYSAFLYRIRCSIVHNNETELHISHFNLTPTVSNFIDTVFLQPLLLLCYDLFSDPSSKAWYTGPELQLYKN